MVSSWSKYGPSDQLLRLLFTSKQSTTVRKDPRAAVDWIKAASFRHNLEAGVTGVLLAHGAGFLQGMEGTRYDVNRVLTRILRDPRHYDVRILSEAEIGSRAFPFWSVCERSMSEVDEQIAGILDYRGELDVVTLDPKSALRLLLVISQVHARAAAAPAAAAPSRSVALDEPDELVARLRQG